MDDRISWHDYFMAHAVLASTRSTCVRRKVGAVAVGNGRTILATGYNGAPRNHPHCTKETCLRYVKNIPSGEQLDVCRAIHAEQNVVISAARNGVSLVGSTIYCTTAPCITCLKILCNVAVAEVYYMSDYPEKDDHLILNASEFQGIIIKKFEPSFELTLLPLNTQAE